MTTEQTAAFESEIQEHLHAETAKDFDALLEGMTDDCFNFVVADPTSPYIGPAAVEARYRKLFDAFPDLRIEMNRLITVDVENNLAVTENLMSGTQTGTLFGIEPTGKAISIKAIVVWEFDEDRKIRGESIYYDLATILRQIGYLTLPGSRTD